MEQAEQELITGLRKTAKQLSGRKVPYAHIVVEVFKCVEGSLGELFPHIFSRGEERVSFYTGLRELREKETLPEQLFYDIIRLKKRRDYGAAHHGPAPREQDALFARATLLNFLEWLEHRFPVKVVRGHKTKKIVGLPIYRELMEYVAKNPGMCDDCIANDTEIQPRQKVRYYLMRLAAEGIVHRDEAWCPSCCDIAKGRTKITTLPLDMPGDPMLLELS